MIQTKKFLLEVSKLFFVSLPGITFLMGTAEAKKPAEPIASDLAELSIEELMAIQITSVSKRDLCISEEST